MMKVLEQNLIDAAAVVADEASSIMDITLLYGYSAQVSWTSTTAVATIKMQESNDGLTWSDVSGGSQAVASDSGSVMLNLPGRMAKWSRVLVDWTSGSVTTLKVDFYGKG